MREEEDKALKLLDQSIANILKMLGIVFLRVEYSQHFKNPAYLDLADGVFPAFSKRCRNQIYNVV